MKTKLNRIEVGGAGVGESSQADIEHRAGELARSDGRFEVNEIDRRQARQELGAQAAEDSPEDKIVETERSGNGSPSVDTGIQAERIELDDETNLAEALVEEGVAEAEHDSRLHSNDRK